ncbi:MAG: hypothetical protein JOZ48_23650 [Acidobacteriaceae bacterium]|nr:hypothetical protein [Acidobacteriaceae bacterium]
MGFSRSLFAPLSVLACFPVFGQSVISVHSGVVHFSEGSVFINNQPLDQKPGTFANVKEGSTLRTEQGRAEILLTPGVFLRVDKNSAIKMISSAITDTQVEFLEGSIIIDSLDAPADSPVAAIYKESKIRFSKHGIYRLDSEPAPLLQVYSGEAQVDHEGKSSTIDTSHLFFFAAATETKKFDDGTDDDFYAWARDRNQAIESENQLAAQTAKDPADMDNGVGIPAIPGDPNFGGGGPTYAPFGGIYSMGGTYYDPYAPFGMSAFGFGAYPVLYPVLVYGRYPARSRSSWSSSTSHSRWPSAGIGISHYQPTRPTIIVPHTVPVGIGTIRSGVSRPIIASPRPVAPVAARPIGHR